MPKKKAIKGVVKLTTAPAVEEVVEEAVEDVAEDVVEEVVEDVAEDVVEDVVDEATTITATEIQMADVIDPMADFIYLVVDMFDRMYGGDYIRKTTASNTLDKLKEITNYKK